MPRVVTSLVSAVCEAFVFSALRGSTLIRGGRSKVCLADSTLLVFNRRETRRRGGTPAV
jgi:hypothetical protein